MQINDKLAEGCRAMFENDRETAERHFACIYGDSEMKSLTPRRVELWLVNFNLGRGSEQGGVWPTHHTPERYRKYLRRPTILVAISKGSQDRSPDQIDQDLCSDPDSRKKIVGSILTALSAGIMMHS